MIQIDIPMPERCDDCRFCYTEYTDDDKPDSFAYCCAIEKYIVKSCDGTDKAVSTAILVKQPWCPLKAQEPRVMTLEQLDDWDGAIFFECYETDMYYALIENVNPLAAMKGEYTFVNVEPGQHHMRTWDGEGYGKVWRCWTSRPTDVQREKEPWNG